MRYRVDTRFGYISFDESDKAKAERLFNSEDGLRLSLCEDLSDKGVVIAGIPESVDISPKKWFKA